MSKSLYISWSEKDNIGIPLMDEQHRGIVSVINSLYYFMQRGEGEDTLLRIMDMLEHYIKIHFIVEENLMEEAGYAKIKEHSLMHEVFLKKMQNTKAKITTVNEPMELLKSLKERWFGHIKAEDAKYVSLVKKAHKLN